MYLTQNLALPLKGVWSGASYLFSATFSFLICKMGYSFFPHRLFVGINWDHAGKTFEIMHHSIWKILGLASEGFILFLLHTHPLQEKAGNSSAFGLLSYKVPWCTILVILLQQALPFQEAIPDYGSPDVDVFCFFLWPPIRASLLVLMVQDPVRFVGDLCSSSFPGTAPPPSTWPSWEPCWCAVILSLDTVDCSGGCTRLRISHQCLP